jgi:hypothetical protein
MAQALRRSIRILMVSHAQAYPNSFPSHMVTSAVMWLLAGRKGLPLEQREQMVSKAHYYVSLLKTTYPDDPVVEEALKEVGELQALVTMTQIQATENTPKEGDLPQDEFMAMMEEVWKVGPEEDSAADS